MVIIGLTGPSGSGKGWVCSILAERGIPSVDTDAVYHSLLVPPSPCLDELAEAFGASVIKNGALDRTALASIVFSDPAQLTRLNQITHKYILAKTDEILSEFKRSGCSAAIVDAPALYESGYDQSCSFVIAVTAPSDLRIARIVKRDGISECDASKRILAQHADDFYTSRARYTVCNDNNEAALRASLDDILRQEGL